MRAQVWHKYGPYRTPLQRELAGQVRHNLKRAGVEQTAFADMVGYSAKHVSQALTGTGVGSLQFWNDLLVASRKLVVK